jgi:hypothetical protein
LSSFPLSSFTYRKVINSDSQAKLLSKGIIEAAKVVGKVLIDFLGGAINEYLREGGGEP